ncbi:response regulator [Candidatus Saccharibacteria bacterium]|nr:response regulator [Candidatus Saccharibacteria bacterium]
MRIFIIDDDELFAECVSSAAKKAVFLSADEISEKNTAKLSAHPCKTASKTNKKITSKTAQKSVTVEIYKNALDAMNNLVDPLPDLIFLDILLPGPDGFTFLNEIVSYPDTAKIPIVLITSLNLEPFDLKVYGVKGILNKEKMSPKDVTAYVERYQN